MNVLDIDADAFIASNKLGLIGDAIAFDALLVSDYNR